mmetsp:Transcript_23682/g.49346  ORF Transcript_23682/g.49346 Transcript_23682/m.49346 type:complete len:229 (-) Transcript_23682:555-1241(-)
MTPAMTRLVYQNPLLPHLIPRGLFPPPPLSKLSVNMTTKSRVREDICPQGVWDSLIRTSWSSGSYVRESVLRFVDLSSGFSSVVVASDSSSTSSSSSSSIALAACCCCCIGLLSMSISFSSLPSSTCTSLFAISTSTPLLTPAKTFIFPLFFISSSSLLHIFLAFLSVLFAVALSSNTKLTLRKLAGSTLFNMAPSRAPRMVTGSITSIKSQSTSILSLVGWRFPMFR